MNTILEWDQLEQAVDHLAVAIRELANGPDEGICCLRFDEAEALAEVLDAGHHADVAARLMHRWALTEPNRDEHEGELRKWIELDVVADSRASTIAR